MCRKSDVTVTFDPLPDGKFDAVCRVPFATETCTWRVTICSQSVARVRYYALLGIGEEYKA